MRSTRGAARGGNRGRWLGGVSLAALMAPMLLAGGAGAVEFSAGGLTGSFDTTLAAGALLRVQERDAGLVGAANGGTAGSINGDNGNLNYDRGLASLVWRATHELKLNYENFGAFTRATYFYDWINAANSSTHGARTDRFPLSDAAVDAVGRDFRLLDAYVFGNFDLGDHPLDVRVGNQVLSWGESTFIPNGINVINPFDVAALRSPGSEIRDALVPVPVVDVRFGITPDLSIEGFYQFAWKETRLEPAGTMFSTNDFASPGGGANGVYLGFGNPLVPDSGASVTTPVTPFGSRVQRAPDRDADDQGQFGFAVRYFAEGFNQTEFGAYFVNYHSRTPIISAQVAPLSALATGYAAGSRYLIEYPEDIRMFGVSFNTNVLGVTLQGEYSLKQDQPLQIDDVELLQAALSPAIVTAAPAATPIAASNQVLRNLGAGTREQIQALAGRELRGYRLFDVSQAQVGATKVFGPAIGADQWLLVGEVGVTHVHDMPDKSVLRLDGPGTYYGGNRAFLGIGGMNRVQTDGFADQTSWGYRLRARFDYLNAVGPVNLFPVLSWSHDVNGTTPLPLGTFLEDRKAVSVGLQATYLDAWQAEVQWTSFFGGEDFNLLHDRDFVSMTLKYSF